MRAICYIRVSTDRQATEGISMESQEAKMRKWADLNDADGVEVFTDAGISGKKVTNRPGLQAALAELKKGDALIVYSLSRLSRNTMNTLKIEDLLKRRGAALVSLSEKIDTTSACGRMFFRMLAVMHEFESEVTGERVAGVWAHQRAKGCKCGGLMPYGYRTEAGSTVLVDVPEEQDVIAEMRRLRNGGLGHTTISRLLNAYPHPSRTGGAWSAKMVRQVLDRKALVQQHTPAQVQP